MVFFLVLFLIYLLFVVLLLAVGLGIGFGLQTLFAEIELGAGIIIGILATSIPFYFLLQTIGYMVPDWGVPYDYLEEEEEIEYEKSTSPKSRRAS